MARVSRVFSGASIFAAIVLAMLGPATPALADSLSTVAYEGFSYSAGTLNGSNGGTGWAGAWAYPQGGDSPLAVTSTGLTYTGLTVTGGATAYQGTRAINGSGRDLSTRLDSGVVYVQFLMQLSGGFNNGAPTFRLFDTVAADNSLLIGSNNTGNNASIITTESTPRVADSGVNINDNQIHLAVVRIDHTTSTTDLWVDPDLSTFSYTSPPMADATLTSWAPAFDRIYLYNRVAGSFDEITISTLSSSTSGTSPSGTTTTDTLSLGSGATVTCTGGNPAGTRGSWLALPAADACSPAGDTPAGSVLLGWSTSADFPVDRAQDQIDRGWGVIDEDINGVRMIFIPAGMATFLSGPNTLYPVWAPPAA